MFKPSKMCSNQIDRIVTEILFINIKAVINQKHLKRIFKNSIPSIVFSFSCELEETRPSLSEVVKLNKRLLWTSLFKFGACTKMIQPNARLAKQHISTRRLRG